MQILSVKTDPIKLRPPESDLDRKPFVSGRGSAKQIRFQNSLTAVMFFSCKEGNLFREKVICVRKIDYFALEAELKFKRKKEIKMPQNIVLRQEERRIRALALSVHDFYMRRRRERAGRGRKYCSCI